LPKFIKCKFEVEKARAWRVLERTVARWADEGFSVGVGNHRIIALDGWQRVRTEQKGITVDWVWGCWRWYYHQAL
jgi:hypothetical protein